MSERAIVRMTGVDKAFGGKQALAGVDLHLDRGEVVGFVGPNGAGKSTCLRILVGLVDRDAGDVAVLGHDPARASLAVRRRCSYLPGETSVYQGMTGGEFLAFALGFYGARSPLSGSLHERFPLPLHQRVRAYSAGMKQKLALLATLLPDVDLYLLDEPDRALDATARHLLREALRELADLGKTVLLSSHHLAEIEAIADRTQFIFDGRCVDDGRLRAARARLRRRVRVRLAPAAGGAAPAAGAIRDDAGWWVFEPNGDPLAWLARLEPGTVDAAEVGRVHLDELYRLLSAPEEEPR